MALHYRNKTIFDWKTYKRNKISSIISLDIMDDLKIIFTQIDIQNIIIRNINVSVGIIIQLNENLINDNIFNIISEYIKNKEYELKFFAIQTLYNQKFEKGKNIKVYKNEYIKFLVNYFNPVIISLLPHSFYQPNIKLLNKYYEKFNKWIQLSKCYNMINLGDDGGNICTILHKFFKNMITLFHCCYSYKCAEDMIKENNINNLVLTYEINTCINFDNSNENIILFINPGRNGLRNYELDFINNSQNIHHIIYLACNYNAFLENKYQLDQYMIIDQIELDVMPLTRLKQNLIYMKK